MPINDTELQQRIERELNALYGDPSKAVRDVLGPVDQSASFDRLMTQIARAAVANPSSIYYLIFLAKNSFRAQCNVILGELDAIDATMAELGIRPEPVNDLTQLNAALTALTNLENRLLRDQQLDPRSTNQYLARLDQFLQSELLPNVRTEQGALAVDSGTARAFLQLAVARVADLWEALVTGVDQMLGELDAFLQLSLASLLAADTVSSARRAIRDIL